MTNMLETSVEIMGKTYQIKCPEEEVASLQRAANYLQDKMRQMRDAGIISADRVVVITALNIVHQLLTLERSKEEDLQKVQQCISSLEHKLEQAMAESAQLEL